MVMLERDAAQKRKSISVYPVLQSNRDVFIYINSPAMHFD
jgi:hypothetical protein